MTPTRDWGPNGSMTRVEIQDAIDRSTDVLSRSIAHERELREVMTADADKALSLANEVLRVHLEALNGERGREQETRSLMAARSYVEGEFRLVHQEISAVEKVLRTLITGAEKRINDLEKWRALQEGAIQTQQRYTRNLVVGMTAIYTSILILGFFLRRPA
jgi:hypothetical protein